MIATVINPPRRRRRRNSWKGHSRKHRRAALKAWRGRRKHRRVGRPRKHRYFTRSRGRKRRRSPCVYDKSLGYRVWRKKRTKCGRPKGSSGGAALKGYTPGFGTEYTGMMNPHRRRRRRGRRYARNPGGGGGITSSAIAGFKPNVIMDAVPFAAGMLGTTIVAGFLSRQGFMPNFLKTGIGAYGLGLVSAGLNGIITRFIAPSYATPVVVGGVIETLRRALTDNVPTVRSMMLQGLGEDDDEGMGDYLSVSDARRARPLGDYLSVADSRRTRPLYGMNPLQAGDPFASFDPSGAIPTTDQVIDATAAAEIV